MYSVRYSKQALKVMIRMPKGIAGRIGVELAAIAANPLDYRGDRKPLQGTPFWRLRVGDWRAVCEIVEDQLMVYVLKIGTRGDVYK